jgi:hypothetical protein
LAKYGNGVMLFFENLTKWADWGVGTINFTVKVGLLFSVINIDLFCFQVSTTEKFQRKTIN